jgi:hypothetical protein
MTVPKHLLGVKGDECQCGRRMSIRHCPACGSSRSYARLNRYHRYLNGDVKLVVTEFRCQTCGHLFVEEEREFCDAPPVSAPLAQQKLKALAEAAQTGEHLNPNDKKLADAVEKLVQKPKQTPEQVEVRLKNTWFEFRRVYLDGDETVKSKTLAEFIEENLRGFLPDSETDQILSWQREVDNVKSE